MLIFVVFSILSGVLIWANLVIRESYALIPLGYESKEDHASLMSEIRSVLFEAFDSFGIQIPERGLILERILEEDFLQGTVIQQAREPALRAASDFGFTIEINRIREENSDAYLVKIWLIDIKEGNRRASSREIYFPSTPRLEEITKLEIREEAIRLAKIVMNPLKNRHNSQLITMSAIPERVVNQSQIRFSINSPFQQTYLFVVHQNGAIEYVIMNDSIGFFQLEARAIIPEHKQGDQVTEYLMAVGVDGYRERGEIPGIRTRTTLYELGDLLSTIRRETWQTEYVQFTIVRQ